MEIKIVNDTLPKKEEKNIKIAYPYENEVHRVIQYWRNSLADAEKMGLATNRMKEGEIFDFSTFKSGQLPNNIIRQFFDINKKNKSDKFSVKNNTEENDIASLQVIIAPYSLVKNREHGKKIDYRSPEEVLPLWIIATLTKEGKLLSSEETIFPWIERKCLTPNEDRANALGYPIIGDVVQVDNYYLKNTNLFKEGKCSWEDLFSFSDELLKTLLIENQTKFSDQGYTLLETGYLLPSNEIMEACKNIIGTYDQYLADTNKKTPPLLDMFCSLQDHSHAKDYSIDQIFMVSQQHVGQMQNNHPLSLSQRISFSYLSDPIENDIFTIHGPPGTGKTSLLLSVIASKWVEAALLKKPPPIIVAASTNNLAVTNILDAFNAAASLKEHTIRWIPDFKSYGLYLISNSKENIKTAVNKGYPHRLREKNSGSIEILYSKNYHENALTYFLKEFNQYYQRNETDISFCQAYIHRNMQEKQYLLNTAIDCIKNLYTANETIKKNHGDINAIDSLILENTIDKLRIEEQLSIVKKLLVDWLLYKKTELKWLILFSWIPFVKLQLFDKIRLFAFRNERKFPGTIAQVNTIDHILNIEVIDKTAQLAKIEEILVELDKAKKTYQQIYKEKFILEKELGFEFSIDNIFDFGDTENILCKLDITLRYDLFFLATHYWEATWLIESEIYATLNYSFEGRQKYWQIQAMLTPCCVTTLHSGPGFFQYRTPSQQFETLAEFVDLLIIDEAGQVMPALAGALISTAKKTLLVGDAKQIEPIVTLTEGIDFANAKKFGLCADIEVFHQLKTSGILCSGDSSTGHAYGNVIIVGQRKARFHLENEVLPGMLLKEHRRCAKEIISYCNELCYDNQLIPMTQESPCIYPRMGYAHIKGFQEKNGSSRCNILEAEAIIAWIVKNEKNILATCGAKNLADCIGIVTPFSAQKIVIQKALNENNIDLDKAGTIHSLQGAEKSIIIFSPVYTAGDYQGKLFLIDQLIC